MLIPLAMFDSGDAESHSLVRTCPRTGGRRRSHRKPRQHRFDVRTGRRSPFVAIKQHPSGKSESVAGVVRSRRRGSDGRERGEVGEGGGRSETTPAAVRVRDALHRVPVQRQTADGHGASPGQSQSVPTGDHQRTLPGQCIAVVTFSGEHFGLTENAGVECDTVNIIAGLEFAEVENAIRCRIFHSCIFSVQHLTCRQHSSLRGSSSHLITFWRISASILFTLFPSHSLSWPLSVSFLFSALFFLLGPFSMSEFRALQI